MRRLIAIISGLLFSVVAHAIGEWTVFPISTTFTRGEAFNGKIFLLSGNSLCSVEENKTDKPQYYNRLTGLNGNSVFDIIVSEAANRLVIVYNDGNIDFIDANGTIINLPDYANKVIMGDRTILGISERDGKLYVSTGFGFMIVDIAKAEFEDTFEYDISKYLDGSYGKRTTTISAQQLKELNSVVEVNGPGSSANADLAFCNSVLLTANVLELRELKLEISGLISKYNVYEDKWKTINSAGINPYTDGRNTFVGVTALAIDPKDTGHTIVGTFGRGLFEFNNDSLVGCYHAFNGNDVEPIIQGSRTARIGDICFDDNGYVWFTNVAVENPLRCKTPSGNFLKFPIHGYQIYSNGLDMLLIAKNDPYHLKWIWDVRRWGDSQVGIYYDGGTPEDISDDQSVSFSSLTDQDGNNITPINFNYMCEDKDGAIWFLTSSGPFIIDSQIETFKNPGKVRRPKIPRNDGTNLADYLLENVDCSCMAVDAANRKWVGTRDAGLYLLSADGLTQIEHFTTDNSPLPSNMILALACDEESGTLYISCDGGIASYVSDAVQGAENYSNVVCYPNPVRPEYSGNLHITDLKDHTKVRICDITNNVVYSTISEGGSISWNLVGDSGNRINAGVYIVYAIDSEGHGGKVSKFLVVN